MSNCIHQEIQTGQCGSQGTAGAGLRSESVFATLTEQREELHEVVLNGRDNSLILWKPVWLFSSVLEQCIGAVYWSSVLEPL